jgi:Domain of unknown function (DUF1996)
MAPKFFAGRRVSMATFAVTLVALLCAGATAIGFAVTSGGTTVTATPTAPSSAPAAGTSPTSTTSTTSTSTVPRASGARTGKPARLRTTGQSVLISDTCVYSHEANDDPILQPGKTGQSMAHDFFGNTTTSASSTASTLTGGATTCSTSADASAYWTPVLYQNGTAITPTHNLIYWAGLHAMSPAVVAPPAGLEMIAGNENATAPQPTGVISWRCAEPEPQTPSPTPVNCPGTKGLELRVTFPSCWDGTDLKGANQSNVVYPEPGGTCPAGHQVRIPTVIFHVVYPITSAAGLTLSMGPGQQGSTDTAHGDFISGWNQAVLTRLISGCSGTANTCGHVTGADAVVHPKKVVR